MKIVWKWLKHIWPIVIVIGMILLAILSLRSYLKINVAQQIKEEHQHTLSHHQQSILESKDQRMRKQVFAHPLSFLSAKYQNKIVNTKVIGDDQQIASAIQPIKIYNGNHQLVNINPDAWRLLKIITYQSGLIKYVGQHGEFGLGWGATLVQRDFTLSQLHKMNPVMAKAKMDAANHLHFANVTKQSGPILMDYAVANGTQKASSHNSVTIPVGTTIDIAKFATLHGRTYLVTMNHKYIEAQKMFLDAHSDNDD